MVAGPEVDQVAGELGPVVDEQVGRGTALPDKAVQDLHHMLPSQPLAYLECWAFATEHVDSRQGTELLPVGMDAE